MRRSTSSVAWLAVFVSSALACTPTLSAPRGERHLDALARGDRHYHHGRMRDAARAYDEAARYAERRVDRDEALYREAKSLERTGDRARAIAVLDRIARERPVSRRTARALFDASLLRMEAQGEAQPGGAAAGIAGLRRLVVLHPTSGVAGRALRIVLDDFARRDDASGAHRYLRELDARIGSTDLGDDVLVAEADLLHEAGDRAGARALLERTVREHPYPHGQRWDDAFFRLADLAEEERNPRAAAAYLERMLSVREATTTPGSYTLPRFPEAQLRLARLRRDALHDAPGAARAYRTLYEEFDDSTLRDDAMLEHAELLLGAHLDVQGCALLERVVREFEVGRARREAAREIRTRCARRSERD